MIRLRYRRTDPGSVKANLTIMQQVFARWLKRLGLGLLLFSGLSFAGQQVTVVVPYVNLHTGPGVGYPVKNVILKGQTLDIQKLRSDWFEVLTGTGQKGWIPAQSLSLLQNTEEGAGWLLSEREGRHFYERQWELGLGVGAVNRAAVLAAVVSRALTQNLSIDTELSQSLSDFSESDLLAVRVTHHLFPAAKWIPFMGVGFGVIHTQQAAVLVRPEDQTDRLFEMSVGVKRHLWRGFLVRADYQHATILTSRDENESFIAWKLWLGHFF